MASIVKVGIQVAHDPQCSLSSSFPNQDHSSSPEIGPLARRSGHMMKHSAPVLCSHLAANLRSNFYSVLPTNVPSSSIFAQVPYQATSLQYLKAIARILSGGLTLVCLVPDALP